LKLLVIGLDATPPKLLYDEFIDDLPTLGGLVKDSTRYLMRTTYPPITIPAWAVMVTGRTPGELGIYGFRHRKPGDVRSSYIVNSRMIKDPTIWDTLSRKGMKSVVVSVPPSYPPRPIRGYMISCFITPDPGKMYTWPPTLKRELESKFGPYLFDVIYRTEEKDRVIRELWEMTSQHFKVLNHLMDKGWDFFMFVEIGVDRVQHAFWKFFDKSHHKYVPGNPYENVIRDYYKLLDKELEKMLKKVPKDTAIVVVSDHGAKAMKGAFAINQWLMEEGYLKLKEEPKKPGVDIEPEMIDWSKTIAWGWGGYYSRIFINLKGREPNGIVEPKDYEKVIEDLKDSIKSVKGPNGEPWKTEAYTPQELYPAVNGDPPDLMVFLDDLNWRAAGTIGWPTKYLPENDRGPDDAVHDWLGVFTVYDPEGRYSPGDKGEINIEKLSNVLIDLITP